MQSEVAPNKVADLLQKKFREGQLKNSRYSQRAFAQKLGVSSGALSEILKGKRAISTPLKKKMAEALQLSPTEQMDFFDDDLPENLKPARREYFRLSVDQFHLLSDWWHFAILNLLKTKGFRLDQGWIANRLDLPTRTVADALDRLFRQDFPDALAKLQEGRHVVVNGSKKMHGPHKQAENGESVVATGPPWLAALFLTGVGARTGRATRRA